MRSPLGCAALAATALLLCTPRLDAQTVTMYRCTDALGRVTIQNDEPCPKGSREEKRSVDIAATAAPFPTPLHPITPAAAIAPTGPGTDPTLPDKPQQADADREVPQAMPLPPPTKPASERLPPPPLFRCRTPDNDTYLADTGEPRERCLAVDTVGIGGISGLGAGQACAVVYDQCQRVPDEDACDAWRFRVKQAQSSWTFARADSRNELRDEFQRMMRVVADTTCNE